MEASTLTQPARRTSSRPSALLSRLSDERLVEQLRRGNDRAFEVIFNRHHRGLLSFCSHMLGSRVEGEDALQQTFMSAHRALVGHCEQPPRLKPWLYTIARNRCVSMLRARRETQPLDERSPALGPEVAADFEQRDELLRLLADIATLPDSQRAALILSELDDLTHAEIAQALNCERDKVKSLVFQARSSLVERRDARLLPCNGVREDLATLGRSRLSKELRRHLKTCADCTTFAALVRKQRSLIGLALPITPSIGLKHAVLGSTGGGGAGATGAGGGIGGTTAVGLNAGPITGASTAIATGGVSTGSLSAIVAGNAVIVKAAALVIASGTIAVGSGVASKEVQALANLASGAPSDSVLEQVAAAVSGDGALDAAPQLGAQDSVTAPVSGGEVADQATLSHQARLWIEAFQRYLATRAQPAPSAPVADPPPPAPEPSPPADQPPPPTDPQPDANQGEATDSPTDSEPAAPTEGSAPSEDNPTDDPGTPVGGDDPGGEYDQGGGDAPDGGDAPGGGETSTEPASEPEPG